MKNFILSFFCFLTIASTVGAQVTAVKNEEDALKTAEFLLTKPIDVLKDYRSSASAYLFQWMNDTSDYTFAVDSSVSMLDSNDMLMGVYLAAMVKYQIINKIKKPDNATKIGIWNIIADYVENKEHKVKVRGKLKKLVAAHQKGTLEDFLDN